MRRGYRLPTWALVTVLAVIFVAAIVADNIVSRPVKGMVARVYLDGEMIHEVDLSAVTEGYEFTVECAEGYNVVSVRPGGICVSSADCSDNTCVKQGWLAGGYTPIVCLPHGLVIRMEAPEEAAPSDEMPFDVIAG